MPSEEIGSCGDAQWPERKSIGLELEFWISCLRRHVWEWVSDTFAAYPGFVVDPYAEYSQPYFGEKKVLRGGAWTTRSRLIRSTWRNFYKRQRRNILAGFRTVAA